MAVRAAGHGFKVIIIQFMKGRGEMIGEYNAQKKLKPELEVYQFGRHGFIDTEKPKAEDYAMAREGLTFAKEMLKKKPKLLILDELNLAVHIGLLPLEDVLELLEITPLETTVILTGRYAPQELMETADLVTEMRMVKHPYDKGKIARKGIEY